MTGAGTLSSDIPGNIGEVTLARATRLARKAAMPPLLRKRDAPLFGCPIGILRNLLSQT
jgi:hypothetical protein